MPCDSTCCWPTSRGRSSINASTMTVFGLSAKGEAQIQLNPTGREDLPEAGKEMLSGHCSDRRVVCPVYLQRWTRMGQMRERQSQQLLLLGETRGRGRHGVRAGADR